MTRLRLITEPGSTPQVVGLSQGSIGGVIREQNDTLKSTWMQQHAVKWQGHKRQSQASGKVQGRARV